ncbi:MAG TPA: T9SS type A sorting domain-containing protein [Bacteroidia bacterium]
MTKLAVFVTAFVLSCSMLKAQTLNGPESIEFDPNDGKYFVGNTGSGAILKLSPNGTLQNFATGVANGPYGLELVGDTLYACSGGNIKMINRVTGATIATINVGGSFLNGITHKGTNLYITDFSSSPKRIIRLNTLNRQFNVFCNTLGNKTPNGIIYDDIDDRLVYCCWGSNAPVHAISFADSTVTLLGTTTLGSCDGIAMNCSGDFYIASWSPNRITKFSHTITSPTTFMSTGISSPADIYYNREQDSLYVPNGNNTVKKAGDVSCLVSLKETTANEFPLLYPNPASDKISFNNENIVGAAECIITDIHGRVVKKAILSGTARTVDINELKNGMYIVVLKSEGKTATYKLIKE